MKAFAIFVLLAAFAFAESPPLGDSVSSGEDFLVLVRVADRVAIESPSPAKKDFHATLSKNKGLTEFLGLFRFSDVPRRGEKVLIDGREAWIVAPCQCLGDYRLHFFADHKELITVTFHHQEFIRIEAVKSGVELDLTPESGTKLRERLDSL
jgi:hypothetical protein